MISRKTVISTVATLVLAFAGLALAGCPDKATGGTTTSTTASGTPSATPSAATSAKSSSGSGW